MVNFIALDLILLVLFIIFSSFFLYIKKKNLGVEGSLILYRTPWGIKLINYVGGKFKKTLNLLSYISISLGYFLMVGILFLIAQTVYIYLTTPIASVIRAPPIMPLIPYFPRLFGLQSLFPPFYFTYFIIALIIVATVHEFSHGIFAKRCGIKIKSTGFAFFKYFPALFGAFVEQDEKDMEKKTNFEQMSVLSAGVFANIIVTILFFILLVFFFWGAFNASGVVFDTYSYSAVKIATISMVNGVSLENPNYEKVLNLVNEEGLTEIKTNEKDFVTTKEFLDSQEEKEGIIVLYDDAPAINAELNGIITNINGVQITGVESLAIELKKYSPDEEIEIETIDENGRDTKKVILETNPNNKSVSWLGIGFLSKQRKGVLGKIYSLVSSFKKEHVYYEPSSKMSIFIYDLLWWIILINIAVALFNMLPLGFLDGGRFFYLTIFGITKSKKIAERAFAGITYFLLFLLLVLMVKWVWIFF